MSGAGRAGEASWAGAVALLACVALFASPRAQTSDPLLDLAAPAPRTPFDGKPDLSGVWLNVPPEAPPEAVTLNDVPYATLGDIGAGYRIGLPLQPWAALLKSTRRMDVSVARRDAACGALSVAQLNAHEVPRTIVHAPGTIAVLYDLTRGARQIFTDRPRVDGGTRSFSYGYSRGAWQGDTLVVLTTNYRDDGWLDMNGSPLTAAGRTIERFRRVSVGTLEIEQTIDDRKAYTRPFTTRLTWRLMPDAESIDMRCAEGSK